MKFPRPRKRVLLPLAAMAVIMLLATACTGDAAEVSGFRVGEVYTLRAGERVSADQVVLASDIFLEPGSLVTGTMTLLGSNVVLDGEVQGDVVVIADRLEVGGNAQVVGDLVICVKDFDRSPLATIEGKILEKCADSGSVSAVNVIESGWDAWRESLWFRVSSAIVGALFFGALAALITVMFPRHLVRMSESVFQTPGTAGGIGFLTLLVAAGLTAVYVVSLLLVLPVVLLPLLIVGWLVIGVSSVLGWVALAGPFGVYLLRVLGLGRQPRMVAAAVGGVALVLLLRMWSVFWFTAWIGILATAVLGSVGLGVVILTRAGTRPFPRHDLVPSSD